MGGIGVKQLAHVCVLTHDLKVTEHFYCEVLGLRKVFNFTRESKLFGFYLDTGGRTNIEVFENAKAPFREQGQVDHLCLEVENLDRALDHLRKHKIEIRNDRKALGVDETWQAWIMDPSGTKIELFEYTDRSAQFHGGDREANW